MGVVVVKIACGAVFFCPFLLTSRGRLDYTAERQSLSGAEGLLNFRAGCGGELWGNRYGVGQLSPEPV